MTKLRYRDLLGWVSHPSDEELLSYLDQQLQVKRADRIRKHLEGCWRCRAQRDELEKSIAGIVKNVNALLDGSTGFPALRQSQFADRLRRLALETEPRPPFSGLFLSLSGAWSHRLSTRLALSMLMGILILIFFFRFGSSPPISAKEVLQRAEFADKAWIRNVTTPVVYQKLQVRRKNEAPRRDEVVSREIWHDLSRARFRERIEDVHGQRFVGSAGDANAPDEREPMPPVLLELEPIFQVNHLDWRNPLSPASYASWQRSIHQKSQEVEETVSSRGQKSLTIKTTAVGPFEVDAIVRAELLVRAEDWHPVAQLLEVQGDQGVRGYELTEMAFAVLASHTLPRSLFEELPALSTSRPGTTAPSPKLQPAAVESLASETEAWFALHRVRACIGRPISVVRTESGRLEVRGMVETEVRRSEIAWAIKGIPWVVVKVQTTEEEPSTPHGKMPSSETKPGNEEPLASEPAVPRAPMEKLAIQDLLEQYLRHAGTQPVKIQQEIAALSQEAVAHSEAALEEVWALRRLAEWALSINRGELRISSQRLLETMVRDHEDALGKHISLSRRLLTPVLRGLLSEGTVTAQTETEGHRDLGNSDSPEWIASSLQLFDTVDRMVRLTLGLFADTRFPTASREAALKELQSVFNRAERECQTLAVEVTRAFSESADALVRKARQE